MRTVARRTFPGLSAILAFVLLVWPAGAWEPSKAIELVVPAGTGGGADQIRQYHPSVLIVDEAAFLDDFEMSYAAADPVAAQIIAVSSAAGSWFGDVCT